MSLHHWAQCYVDTLPFELLTHSNATLIHQVPIEAASVVYYLLNEMTWLPTYVAATLIALHDLVNQPVPIR